MLAMPISKNEFVSLQFDWVAWFLLLRRVHVYIAGRGLDRFKG